MKPHKHAEVIKAYADGATIQYQLGSSDWNDLDPECADFGRDGSYRIKPAAPKWPQTTMTDEQIETAAYNAPMGAQWRGIANSVLKYACESGEVVPADKVREIEAKARAEGKREGMNPVHVIEAAWNHMKLGRLDPETIQIILLKAAAK